jgi:hypothetical protein
MALHFLPSRHGEILSGGINKSVKISGWQECLIFIYCQKNPIGLYQKQLQQILHQCNAFYDENNIKYLSQI